MNIPILISRDKIHTDPANPFPPLSEQQYNELYSSIKEHGIIEPLIVAKDHDNEPTYVAVAGNHRLKIAEELGIPELQCMVIEADELEAAYDTELYRRALTSEERKFYAKKIREITKQKHEEKIKDSLIEELYQLYAQGEISSVEVRLFCGLPKEDQQKLYETMQTRFATKPEPVVTSMTEQDVQTQQKAQEQEKAHQEEIEKAKQKQAQLEARMKALDAEKREAERERDDLERRNKDAKRLLKDKIEELEELRDQSTARAAETLKEEVSQQIISIQTQVTRSATAIKEKDQEIDRLKEERDKAKRDLRDNEAKINTVWLAARMYYDSCKDAMNIIFRPDMLRKRITNVKSELEMLDTVWNSYDIDEKVRNEVLEALGNIQKKVNELVRNLPQIQGPKIPAITSAMFEQSKMLPPIQNETQLLQ
ncbi:MAG: ParB N-terminal domain-containing protein [Syntrophobacterales bacterium]|nr:ParB N-terminal domain-containing protein [Syntrophobacterales bacterium]